MFGPWYETDHDCCQHIRKDGNQYEMIQYVWLDTTLEDIQNGLHEYVVLKTELDLNDMTDDDVIGAISSYGYTIISLLETYQQSAIDIIAECLMEEEIMRDCNILDHADSDTEAVAKIMKYIEVT